MSMTAQVVSGSCLLTFCTLLHVGLVAAVTIPMASLSEWLTGRGPLMRNAVLLSVTVLAILFAHTVQIWIWAFTFQLVQIFPDIETSFYFATVTYTTLGYGDIVLGSGLRIFATFSAITGLLTFGISTAFLIAVITRLLPAQVFGSRRP